MRPESIKTQPKYNPRNFSAPVLGYNPIHKLSIFCLVRKWSCNVCLHTRVVAAADCHAAQCAHSFRPRPTQSLKKLSTTVTKRVALLKTTTCVSSVIL